MFIDLLIFGVVIGAAWVGFQRGLIQPLLAELFVMLSALILLHNRSAFAGITSALFHAGGVFAVVIGLVLAGLLGYVGARLGGAIHKMPAVRGVDGFLGVWMQALFAIGFCYVLISGIIVMDRAFNPVSGAPTINAAQLQSLETQLGANAFTATVVDGHALQAFDAQASRPGGVRLSDLPGIGVIQGIEHDFLQPQLAGSHLASLVMSVGRHIPGLGHLGPRDLPRKQ